MHTLAVNLIPPEERKRLGLPNSAFIAEAGRWLLQEDADYYDIRNRCWLRIHAPFWYDMASNIRPLWWFLAPHECGEWPPLVHDALYRYKGALPEGWVWPYRKYTRREADVLFVDAMRFEKVPLDGRRRVAYPVLRAVGWWPWRRGNEAWA